MPETKDLLALKFSNNVSITGVQEATADLQLEPAPNPSTSISGTVTSDSVEVVGATVKLFTGEGYTPYAHTVTAEGGVYSFIGIDAGTYYVAVTAPGYILSAAQTVTVTSGESKTISFSITPDGTLQLGSIAGLVNDNTGAALDGAQVTLNNKTTTETVAVTTTIEDGEFAFYDVANGSYSISVVKFGYLTAEEQDVTISDENKIANMTSTLTIDTTVYKGTVSGVVKDEKNAIVPNSFVGLYSVTTNMGVTTETLVAVTKTNAAGQYLFANVDAGTYVVKAKKNAA